MRNHGRISSKIIRWRHMDGGFPAKNSSMWSKMTLKSKSGIVKLMMKQQERLINVAEQIHLPVTFCTSADHRNKLVTANTWKKIVREMAVDCLDCGSYSFNNHTQFPRFWPSGDSSGLPSICNCRCMRDARCEWEHPSLSDVSAHSEICASGNANMEMELHSCARASFLYVFQCTLLWAWKAGLKWEMLSPDCCDFTLSLAYGEKKWPYKFLGLLEKAAVS